MKADFGIFPSVASDNPGLYELRYLKSEADRIQGMRNADEAQKKRIWLEQMFSGGIEHARLLDRVTQPSK